jgi:dihydroorotate dehydrogenase
VEIIGVGGIKDVATALEKIKAGARAVQVVTAIRGEGTTLAGRITRGIAAYLDKTGAKSVEELIGIDAK